MRVNEIGPFGFWELFAAAVGISVLLSIFGVWSANRFIRRRFNEGQNEVAVAIYTTAGTVFAVLQVFTVVIVWERFTASEVNVSSEASILTTMYRQTIAMPNPERLQIRALLWKYTDAVVGPEWKVLRSGGTSPVARATISEVYRVLGTQAAEVAASPVNSEFMTEMSDLTTARNMRILDAKSAIPSILWIAMFIGDIVVIVLGCFLYMKHVWLQAILSAGLACLIGVLLFTVFVLDHPFQGRLGLTPADFEHSLSVFRSIDRGSY
jgi:uncharacterized protein DUF4239